ncbi:tripartite motif-containing protein 44 isoform X2 [Amia ocellicauda]|uniref:tripartite motif-containing protein 44 isoform X2 n=1 Tax=Amia ocellicauda TaxID=2972642 RepID=UPI0034639ECE
MDSWEEPEQEELQNDGTCDACEPDEALPAAKICHSCNFAFCDIHAEKHHKSTRHNLEPYGDEEAQRTNNASPGDEGSIERSGSPEEGAAGGGAGLAPGIPENGKVRESVTVERLRCKEHGQEGTLYCKLDEKIICVVCAVQGAHREHEIITLREAYMWQRNKEPVDILGRTVEVAERLKTKWSCPNMGTEDLEAYVNKQFDELHQLVRQEERRTLHLVDLKEAFLTAQAAEKIAEITVHTEKLQEEMASITKQLGALDHGEDANPLEKEANPRPEPRQDPPGDNTGGSASAFNGHAP